MKQTDTQYGNHVISLFEVQHDEFMIEAWHTSQNESDTEPALIVEGSFNNAISAYIYVGETIAKAELK